MPDYKPTNQFDGQVGNYSEDEGSPEVIKAEIVEIQTMFDPDATHADGTSQGGIGAGNMKDGAATDDIVGDRTVDDTTATAYANTGALTQILSWLAKQLKAIIGGEAWSSTPPDTLTGLDTRATTNANAISNLAGSGRTTETVKGNADNLTTHKTSSDHDGRYYTEAELNSGQLDNRYYTETELNNGQLDTRYLTEAELFALISQSLGAIASINNVSNPAGNVTLEAGTGISLSVNAGLKKITITATGVSVPAPHQDLHKIGGSDAIQSFNWDWLCGFPGYRKRTQFDTPSAGAITISLIDVATDDVVATCVTTFDTPNAGDITKVVTVTGVGSMTTVTEFDTPVAGDITETNS